MKRIFILPLLLLCLLTACSREAAVPEQSTPVKEQASIYPDYRDIIIPPNIAPLNVQVKSEGLSFAARLSCGKEELVSAAGSDGKFEFDTLAWRKLLKAARGADITVELYAEREQGWVSFPAYKISVAQEPIDRYLSYRLIEPSYELYRQLGLYQRDLETFDVTTIYENNRTYEEKENHCVNCHTFQAGDTRRMLFHVRAKHGGTVFVNDGKAEKINMQCDSILSSTVYPTWHPTQPWVVFSSNQTGQAFHMVNKQKVEVMDYGSDLVFYDVEANRLSNILKTELDLETFPCWSADGRKLFYCAAHVEAFRGKTKEQRMDIIPVICDSVRYNLMSMTFDAATRTFGAPVTEFDCVALNKSAAMPQVSPDGRYVLFTLGDYGQFHVWHTSSDLYVKDLVTGEVRPLKQANSPAPDSTPAWSGNGRWLVTASRRDDGSYTRPYIAYFDREGRDHKAFLLPQLDPEQNIMLGKSYNVPRFTKSPVTLTKEDFEKCIRNDEGIRKVQY